MRGFFFISYSSVDAKDFAMKLADTLLAGPPEIPVWLDKRELRPGEDWDEQVAEAITNCKGTMFVMSADSVRPDSVCKPEWVRALKYKKPVIPLLLDREAEVPFRLSYRQYINFTGSFDSAIARLRMHLSWMDSPEGHLQALKYRLSDAQRELPRAEAEQQARIRDDIAELQRQIADQQALIEDPEGTEQRVRKRVEAGLEVERRPAMPAGGITHGKFINPPPLIAPNWFQDRDLETQQIGAFLGSDSLRLMTVVGRGGVGKTAMVCRLLRALEGGRLPGDGEGLTVDGVVYLSAGREFHRPNFPDIYAGLTMLLPDETVKRLDAVYKNPRSSTRATVAALVDAFPHGRTVVLLDNFEDILDVETRRIRDAELDETLRAILELPPHGLKIIITTRVAPGDLALVEPALQRRLDLDAGLEHPYAENILRAMDADGKVGLRNAPERLLSQARDRTLGYPRALEHLFGVLSADRDASLQQILDDTRRFLPEQVVAVLVGEAFSRLDVTAQRVMQALAVYRYPVPPAAVDYLLQPYVPGIDSARVLSRLVNMQFLRRDAGRYYLHQVDRDYALSRIPKGDAGDREAEAPPMTCFALRHRAAEWFKLSRKPRETWKTLGDLAAQLSEFDLRCDGGEYDTAAAVLLDFDFNYLLLWGHYRLMTELHQRLQGNVSEPKLAMWSVSNLGVACYRMGQVQPAIRFYENGLKLARQDTDRWTEGACLLGLGSCFSDVGQHGRAMEYYEEALAIYREINHRGGQARVLGCIGSRYLELGKNAQAIEYYEQALSIDREIKDRENEATDLHNMGSCYTRLDQDNDALRCYSQALDVSRDIGCRLVEAGSRNAIGWMHLLQGRWSDAAGEFQKAIGIGDEIGNPLFSRAGRENLALVNVCRHNLDGAREVIEAARKYDVPLYNHATSATLGLVALRQGDLHAAKEAFTSAISEADHLIALTAGRYDALDTKSLALCGLALCGDLAQIPAAKAAFRAARAVTSNAGTVRDVLFQFDTLAQADINGILAEVRAIAAGTK